ncbi:MAG: Esterase [Acidimicrobiia bacterium]|nr:Esterase [Acidimicrobiia bacterium]
MLVRRSPLFIGLALAVLAASLLTGPAAPAAALPEKQVTIVGDSVMLMMGGAPYSGAAQRVIGGAGWDTVLDAKVSRPTTEGGPVLQSHQGRLGGAVVLGLGYNDAGNPEGFRIKVNAILAQLGNTPEVVWLTLHEVRPGYAAANQVLRDTARTHSNFHVIDWNAAATGHSNYFGGDSIHLTGAGATAMAQLILGELERWYNGDTVDLSSCRPSTNPPAAPAAEATRGYWLLDSAGRVWAYDAPLLGDIQNPYGVHAVDMASTASGAGYWITDARGHVWAFGDAALAGDLTGVALRAPIVAIVASPTGNGYWLLASDGGVFAFGSAPFQGSMGGTALQGPVTSMAAVPRSTGYWLTGSDGGVFAFGAAPMLGAGLGRSWKTRPVTQLVPRPSADGYWLRSSQGDVTSLGAAPDEGDLPRAGYCRAPAVADMAATRSGAGYWMLGVNGSVFTFGDAAAHGQPPSLPAGVHMVAMALYR